MATRRVRVLVVEDDESVRELVALHLRRAGFSPLEAADAETAWTAIGQADVLVLDRMLPGESGDALLKRIRAHQDLADLPVLMLTALAGETDRVGGLDAGADDYITKPFSAAELVARLRAVSRRLKLREVHEVGDVTIDVDAAEVTRLGERVELTRREFDLLAFLAANRGRVFSRADLLDKVWGLDFPGGERTVDQHVAQLRSRLGDGIVETARGRGYRIGGDG